MGELTPRVSLVHRPERGNGLREALREEPPDKYRPGRGNGLDTAGERPPPSSSGKGERVWIQYTDDDTGRRYYVDDESGETTWDKPRDGAIVRGD